MSAEDAIGSGSAPQLESGWGPRTARWLVVVLFIAKVAVTFVNLENYDGYAYDAKHHIWRVTQGWEASPMAYNPPLYYVPTFGMLDKDFADAKQVFRGTTTEERKAPLRRMRHMNAWLLVLTYAAWLFVVIPRFFESWTHRTLASVLILALPGFQKLAMSPHPDNLHATAAALLVAAWIWAWHRKESRLTAGERDRDWGELALLVAFAVLAGWTRPFAVVTVGGFMGLAILHALRGRSPASGAFVARAAFVVVVGGIGASGWYVERYRTLGQVAPAYDDAYMKKFKPLQADFEFLPYFTSFHFDRLYAKPHRRMSTFDGTHEEQWAVGNSFFTIAYSELWGDHWLIFTGNRRATDWKVWPKRTLFVAALPLTLFLVAGLIWALVRIARTRWRELLRAPPDLTLGLYVVGSLAVFLAWQTTGGLTPGKQSGIKFIYNAFWAPAACLLAVYPLRRPAALTGLTLYTLVIFGIAMPLALYWPR